MALTFASKKDRDWFAFVAENGSCKVEVQRIPVGKAREIEARVLGRLRTMNVRQGTVQWDIEKQAMANRDLAIFALLGFDKDAETDITSQELADALAGANNGKAFQVGDHICLAEVKLNDAAKGALLDEAPALVGWLLDKSQKLHTKAKEEEEGKD